MVTGVLAGAVQRYHTECPPESPAWFGSPVSLVAPTLLPVTLPVLPLSDWPLAKASFTGCALPDRLTNPLAFGDTWRTGAGEGGGKVYLHRESPSAPWTVATVLHSGDALQWDWRADYSDFHQGLPYRIHLVSRDTRRFDLQLTLSQVETGVLLASNVFRVQIPASAVPITLEELRRSGPLGSK